MEKKCIIFSRVSTEKQTLEQQTDKLIEEAHRRGYADSQLVIIEEKESATLLDISERKGLQRLKEVLADDIECIIIYELSRLSRKPADLYKIRDMLIGRGINLISLTPAMELLDRDGRINSSAMMVFGIYGTLSEQEGYLRTERVKRGIAKKKSEGKVMGRVMIMGYRRVDGRPVIHEDEAVIIREVFSRFEAGESCGAIGYDLYLRGIFGDKIKRGSAVCRVSGILAEERYAGVWPFPAIVTRKQYDRCREIIAEKSKNFARLNYTDKDYYCAGLLYTDKGYAMCPSYGNRRYQYRDPDRQNSLNVNMDIVDGLSRYALRKYLESGADAAEKELEIKELQNKIKINTDKDTAIRAKLKALEDENNMIENRIIKGRIPESKGDTMIDENLAEIKKLEDLLDDILYENGVFQNRLIYLNSFVYEGGAVTIPDTPGEIKAALRKYIKRIIVNRTGYGQFNLTYLFTDGYECKFTFVSVVHNRKFWDSEGREIKEEELI